MRTVLVSMLLMACAAPQRPAPESAATVIARDLMRGDYAIALERSERALANAPDQAWLLYDRGVALAGLGRLDESLMALRKAELAFGDDLRGRSLAIFRRAALLEHAGRCDESATELARYAFLIHDSSPELSHEALVRIRFCNAEAAEAAWLMKEHARHHEADRASTSAVRALTLFDYPLALKVAEAGLQKAPDDPWLLYNRGAALAGLQRTNDALDALSRAEHGAISTRGRAIAIYRRAMVLEAAGRCYEESNELRSFGALVGEPGFERTQRVHLEFCRLASDRESF